MRDKNIIVVKLVGNIMSSLLPMVRVPEASVNE